GLSQTDAGSIDEATEDLLASLGAPTGVQLQPVRPSVDLRAAASARSPQVGAGRLDALLAGLDPDSGLTQIDDPPPKFKRDPISDIIKKDPRTREAIVS